MTATHVGIVWNPSKADKEDLDSAWQEAVDSAKVGLTPEVSWFETQEDDPGRGPAKVASARRKCFRMPQ